MDIVEAAMEGDLGRVQELVLQDPQQVHYQYPSGITPLLEAVCFDRLEMARFLLQHGASIHDTNYRGDNTPIIRAAKFGSPPMLDLLLEYGADPTIMSKSTKDNPLMIAAAKKKPDVVARLLRHPAVLSNIDARNAHRETALWVASVRGYGEIVRLLLEAGADPTLLPEGASDTPLLHAITKNDIECLLRDHRIGSIINFADRLNGRTVLMRACNRGWHDTVKQLLRMGADPAFTDYNGRSAMSLTPASHEACITLLKEWERWYLLAKARSVSGAKEEDEANEHLAFTACSSAGRVTRGEVKRARVKSAPPFLKERLEKGKPLPEVHVEVGEVGEDIAVREMDRSVLEKVVLKHVVENLREELFMELTSLVE